jgi:uncharacterized membrane protein
MLILFPFGLWVISLVCDLLYLGGAEAALWHPLALYTMVGGLVVALASAVNKSGPNPATINLIVMALYALNIWLRSGDPAPMGIPIALSVIGVGTLAVWSWFGGKTVHVHRIPKA